MNSARDSERRLFLIAASTAARRLETADTARRLVAEVDWPHLTRVLRSRRLLTTLGPRILELAGESADQLLDASVEEALCTARRQATVLELVTGRVMDALHEAEIACAPLKGPRLAETLYGDAGRRLSGDIDLLVAPEQLRAAVRVMRGLGYRRPRDHTDGDGLPLLHFVLTHESGRLAPVELHWRVHWYERHFAAERLLPRAVGSADWRPAPADELACLLLLYARDGFVGLRQASDLSAWWDRFGERLSAGALDATLRTFPGLAPAIRGAGEAAQRIVGLPIRDVLSDSRRSRRRLRAAARLANPNPYASASQLYADMGLVDALLTPPGGLGHFVRRQLAPPPDVLAQHARHAGRGKRRSMLGHGAGVLVRYALRASRLAALGERLREARAHGALGRRAPSGVRCLVSPAVPRKFQSAAALMADMQAEGTSLGGQGRALHDGARQRTERRA